MLEPSRTWKKTWRYRDHTTRTSCWSLVLQWYPQDK